MSVGVGVEHHLRRVEALLVELVEDTHELEGVVGVGNGVGHVEEQEIDVGHGEQLGVLAHDPRVVGVVVAVERLGEPVHGALGAVLAAVHVVGLVDAVLVNDLLEIEHAVVAVLAVPQEVEQTDLPLGGIVGADVGRAVQGTVQVIRARVAAEEVVVVVGDGVGQGLAVDLVGDGHGLAVFGGGILQRTRVGIVSDRLLLGEGGVGPVDLTGGLLLLALLLLLVGQLGLVLVEVEALGISLIGEEGIVLDVDGLACADVGLQGVDAENVEGRALLGVLPGSNRDDDGLPLAAGIPLPLVIVGYDVIVVGAGAEKLALVLGGGTVADGDVGSVQHRAGRAADPGVGIVARGLEGGEAIAQRDLQIVGVGEGGVQRIRTEIEQMRGGGGVEGLVLCAYDQGNDGGEGRSHHEECQDQGKSHQKLFVLHGCLSFL